MTFQSCPDRDTCKDKSTAYKSIWCKKHNRWCLEGKKKDGEIIEEIRITPEMGFCLLFWTSSSRLRIFEETEKKEIMYKDKDDFNEIFSYLVIGCCPICKQSLQLVRIRQRGCGADTDLEFVHDVSHPCSGSVVADDVRCKATPNDDEMFFAAYNDMPANQFKMIGIPKGVREAKLFIGEMTWA